MHGDFSKLVFRPDKRYSAVLSQQGRVELDSDANEQTLIQLHHSRELAADLIGPHGGPTGRTGFGITYVPKEKHPADLTISGGRYYVDGIPVDADRPEVGAVVGGDAAEAAAQWSYWDQPDAYRDPQDDNDADTLPKLPFLVYLKVSEQLVTAVQDPEIRETALGAALPDTTARIKVTWQVLPLTTDDGLVVPENPDKAGLDQALADWVEAGRPTGKLAVRTEKPADVDSNPCVTSPDSRFRGPENQLYRVEVHRGQPGEDPTFKWSRENGSVVFAVSEVAGTWVTLADKGRDGKLDLDIGDWVEALDDASAARPGSAPLLRVKDVDTERLRVELSGEPRPVLAGRHPFLRRWDHRTPTGRNAPALFEGAVKLTEGGWLDLEGGVQVWFAPGSYRTGDYWTFAARTLTGEVEWPRDALDRPFLAAPNGVDHHHAPLAWITGQRSVLDLRRTFGPLAK